MKLTVDFVKAPDLKSFYGEQARVPLRTFKYDKNTSKIVLNIVRDVPECEVRSRTWNCKNTKFVPIFWWVEILKSNAL